ncbi:MAG TPA: site-specific integrase [Streptosporangiaceae bacterium]
MNTYHVKFWDTKKISDTARGRHRVRWAVDGRERCKSFATKALADAFLGTLKDAARAGKPFDPATGLPAQPKPAAPAGLTWYQHARAYAQMKWPDLAAKSRRATAEALTTITLALTERHRKFPDPDVMRRALFGYAFNAASTSRPVPREITQALEWMAKASIPVAALEDPATVRTALNACARRLDGKPAAATTTRRKRAVFANALGYAVELRLLPANPLDRIQWKASAVAETIDRRSVANPAQAARLLTAVRAQGRRGEHLEAFFACLYYAALRPAEAVALHEADCVLPARGWGRIDLAASSPRAGTEWTDDGASREERGLKHRADNETRSIPIPPVLVSMLRAHIARYGTGPGGRLFRTARGGPLNDTGYGEVWQRARTIALTPAQQASPLARRPYDLRHAAVSLWLNAGVPATEVARRAGHGVAVLLKVYANCIDGQAGPANKRISDALDEPDDDTG